MTKPSSKLRTVAWLLAPLFLGIYAGGLMIAATADVCTQYSMLDIWTVILLPLVVFFGALIAPIMAISLVTIAGPLTLILALPFLLCLCVMLWAAVVFWRRARAGAPDHVPAAIFTVATTIWSAMSTYGFCISLSA